MGGPINAVNDVIGSVASATLPSTVSSHITRVLDSQTKLARKLDTSAEIYAKGMFHVGLDLQNPFKQITTNPKEYTTEWATKYFITLSDALSPYMSQEDAYTTVYIGGVVAALVVSWWFGPEVEVAFEGFAAVIMESLAASISSEVMAIAVYYTLEATAMLAASFVMSYGLSEVMYGMTELYYKLYFGANQILDMIRLKQMAEMDYSSSLLDGSVFDWLAGGIALNGVMAGGRLSLNSIPNDPYQKAFMYDVKNGDIPQAVMSNMAYENLAGGSVWGFNGNSYNVYNPIELNI